MESKKEAAILAILADGQERSSYDLADEVAARLNCSAYDVYPDLRHLASVGKILRREGETIPARNGAPKIYYRLAPPKDRTANL